MTKHDNNDKSNVVKEDYLDTTNVAGGVTSKEGFEKDHSNRHDNHRNDAFNSDGFKDYDTHRDSETVHNENLHSSHPNHDNNSEQGLVKEDYLDENRNFKSTNERYTDHSKENLVSDDRHVHDKEYTDNPKNNLVEEDHLSKNRTNDFNQDVNHSHDNHLSHGDKYKYVDEDHVDRDKEKSRKLKDDTAIQTGLGKDAASDTGRSQVEAYDVQDDDLSDETLKAQKEAERDPRTDGRIDTYGNDLDNDNLSGIDYKNTKHLDRANTVEHGEPVYHEDETPNFNKSHLEDARFNDDDFTRDDSKLDNQRENEDVVDLQRRQDYDAINQPTDNVRGEHTGYNAAEFYSNNDVYEREGVSQQYSGYRPQGEKVKYSGFESRTNHKVDIQDEDVNNKNLNNNHEKSVHVNQEEESFNPLEKGYNDEDRSRFQYDDAKEGERRNAKKIDEVDYDSKGLRREDNSGLFDRK